MHTVSIITPTSDREKHLRLQYETVKIQEGPWEWLICDSSFRPSPYFSKLKDKRVKYIYDDQNLKIGPKRNLLMKQAQGAYVCHFDDDDYYAPHYLSRIRKELENADFFKLTDFFCYSLVAKSYFYWDLKATHRMRYQFHPTSDYQIREVYQPKAEARTRRNGKLGYGFTQAYRRELVDKICFRNTSYGEDVGFARKVLKQGYKMTLIPDREGLAIAVIHDQKTSSTLPQYRLPAFMAKNFFPFAAHFFKKYPKLLY